MSTLGALVEGLIQRRELEKSNNINDWFSKSTSVASKSKIDGHSSTVNIIYS